MKLFTTLVLCVVVVSAAFAQGKSGGGPPHDMGPVKAAPAQGKSGGGIPHVLILLKFIGAAI